MLERPHRSLELEGLRAVLHACGGEVTSYRNQTRSRKLSKRNLQSAEQMVWRCSSLADSRSCTAKPFGNPIKTVKLAWRPVYFAVLRIIGWQCCARAPRHMHPIMEKPQNGARSRFYHIDRISKWFSDDTPLSVSIIGCMCARARGQKIYNTCTCTCTVNA